MRRRRVSETGCRKRAMFFRFHVPAVHPGSASSGCLHHRLGPTIAFAAAKARFLGGDLAGFGASHAVVSPRVLKAAPALRIFDTSLERSSVRQEDACISLCGSGSGEPFGGLRGGGSQHPDRLGNRAFRHRDACRAHRRTLTAANRKRLPGANSGRR